MAEEIKKTKNSKKPMIIGIVAILVIVAVVLVIVLSKKKESYRIIQVNSVEGTASLTRNSETLDVVVPMNLISGDKVSVQQDSLLDLLADTDKHIVAKENTIFSISANGSEKSGNITIQLEKGDALFTIDNKLPDDSTFEVHTPNATISVRGTTFEVLYDAAIRQTHVIVTEGVVNVATNIEEITLNAGEEVYVIDETITTEAAEEAANDIDTAEAVEGAITESDIVILSSAVVRYNGGVIPSTREEYNAVLTEMLGVYGDAESLYVYATENQSDEQVNEMIGMSPEEYKVHFTEVVTAVTQNVGISEPEYDMLLAYIEKTRKSSDLQICDTVRSAVITAFYDPAVIGQGSAVPSDGEYTLAEICNQGMFGDVVVECLGADAASTEALLQSSKAAGGHIMVVIEGTKVTVYCENDDTIKVGM